MTDKIQQARRVAFEAYVKTASKSDYEERGDDLFEWNGATYVVTWVNWDYQLWCAALDCVVIALPEKHSMRFVHPARPQRVAHNEAVEKCRSAIESTNLGIKVK